MDAEIEKEMKKLSNLLNYKDLDTSELEQIARINVLKRNFHKNPLFDIETKAGKKEQDLAEKRFKTYITNNEIESASDIDTLKSLIFNEVFEQRIQGQLNKLQKEDKYPPDKLVKTLVEVQDQKAKLKVKLGIDKKDEETDDLTAYQLTQKRVIKHINDHKDEFTIFLGWQCDGCGKKDSESFLVYKQVKDFKVLKHPYFAGRFLFNYEILKDVKDNKLSKEDAWRYLLCSGQGKFYKPNDDDKKYCVDYIDHCLENFVEITDLLKQN